MHFDNYDFKEYPKDFFQWVKDGADYNAWGTEVLAKDIQSLIEEDSIEFLLLDYPFAYKNDKIAPYIDYSIFIDTPLDIAMARRIIRDMKDELMDLLISNLKVYMDKGRVAYLEMLNSIRPNSDLIVDGSTCVEVIVDTIIKHIEVLN